MALRNGTSRQDSDDAAEPFADLTKMPSTHATGVIPQGSSSAEEGSPRRSSPSMRLFTIMRGSIPLRSPSSEGGSSMRSGGSIPSRLFTRGANEQGSPARSPRSRQADRSSACGRLNRRYDHDDPLGMTSGRRIARHLTRYRWYNPNKYEGYPGDDERAVTAREESASAALEDGSRPGGDEETEAANDVLTSEVAAAVGNRPSIAHGWEYYEHRTLPRHLAPTDKSCRDSSLLGQVITDAVAGVKEGVKIEISTGSGSTLEKCGRGKSQQPTRLYSIWTTTENDLSEFGIGIVIYFWSLRMVAGILFVAGLISIPNLLYFASTEYAADGQAYVKTVLKGSAICTEQVWVACPDCEQSDLYDSTSDRFASAGTLFFILKNKCTIGLEQGIVAYVAFLFVMFTFLALFWVMDKQAVKFDKTNQTGSDYTVQVFNPPGDAKDPDEWREFFTQFVSDECGNQVTCITVALDNHDLLMKMVQRRRLLSQLELRVKPGVDFDPNASSASYLPVPLWRRILLLERDASALQVRIAALEAKIETMASREASVSSVFVTFETEHSQRRALQALSMPLWIIWRDKTYNSLPKWKVWRRRKASLSDNLRFRGKHILSVDRPTEPSAVRWADLGVPLKTIVIELLLAFAVFVLITIGGAFIVRAAYRGRHRWAAFVITVLNIVSPLLCKVITHFESHRTECSKQTSLYIKITLFRWTNTAIITQIVSPFTDEVTNGPGHLINAVFAIFLAEMLLGPAIQLSDWLGNLQRHVLAPRAPDQRRMNLNFNGGYYTLAERQTNMTKIIFLTFWYSTIFPAGFFFASGSLIIHYMTDKFCLLRVWSPAPKMGATISASSRIFFALALIMYIIVQSYSFSGFPYDNACEDTSTVSEEYEGKHIARDGKGNAVNAAINEGDNNYFSCHQDMWRYRNPRVFPARPESQPEGAEWMTDGQATATTIAAITATIVMGLAGLLCLNYRKCYWARKVFLGYFKPSGHAVDDRFSDEDAIFGYVPQITAPGFNHPLLACDISSIDSGLIGWISHQGYDAHSLFADFPRLGNCFSVMKHWPPPGREQDQEGEMMDTRDDPVNFNGKR